MLRLLCVCLLAAVAAVAGSADARAGSLRTCGNEGGYGYAGLQSMRRAHGVRATISALARPYVQSGHVAAWVGVGGPGQGPGGTDAWLQVGLSGYASSPDSKLYYEVAEPGKAARYHQVLTRVDPGQRMRVAVLEMSRRPHHWRVWVNGDPVSDPIHLPRSAARWRPIATAETWDGGRPVCNGFGYRFDRLRVAARRGGSWRRFRGGNRFEDRGYRVVQRRRNGFQALATAFPVWKPGWWEQHGSSAMEPAPATPARAGEPALPVTG